MEPNAILTEITRLVDLTKNGKIIWSTQQPNNFNILKWDRAVEGKNYLVTIQIQPFPQQQVRPGTVQMPVTNFYIFTIVKLNPPPQEVILQLNSQGDAQYSQSLAILYSLALNAAKENSAVILSKLLSGL